MGVVIFWAVFLALLIFALVINVRNDRLKKQERKAFLLSRFGDFDKASQETIDYTKSEGLYNYLTEKDKNNLQLDEITYFDLSLDQLINGLNQTVSSPGEDYLVYKFKTLNQDCSVSRKEWELIEYYRNNKEIRNETLLCLDELPKYKKFDSFKVIFDLKNKKSDSNIIHYILDILLVLSFALIFIFPGPGFTMLFIMMGVNAATYFSGKRKMEEGLYGFAYSNLVINCARKLSLIDEKNQFDEYKDLFGLTKGRFLISFKKGTTSNPFSILADYLKLFLHFDLIYYNSKLKKISEKSEEIIGLYILLGRIDCLISIASFVESQKIFCNFQECDFGEGFEIKGMIHPLNTEPVPNDFENKRGIILTGSNASGKSTFLKACGINVILAQNFGFALAKEYKGPYVRLYSSMSISDNISKRDSFFVAEAKSLKRMCDATCEYSNVFCLIDEVFKGTNTLERISCATSLLKYLAKDSCICFAATHDAELCLLLKDSYSPYYFTEEIVNEVMTFPYKIGKGVAGEGNAVRLLELLSYDKGITEDARNLCEFYKNKGRWE